MKKHIIVGLLASVSLFACTQKEQTVSVSAAPVAAKSALPAGVTLIETITKKRGEVSIPYSKYKLANGLTVVLHEDHSDPLVHVDMTYHVGSGREEVGKSGFAHFFEHMMFQGSEHVGDDDHFKIISEAGGTLNGSTNRDRTNYYETVPNNQLEKMLWLESDRLAFLLDAVTQEKFEIQRGTVKNERGQNVDNRPYGRVSERINEALHPEGHPYSWSTIGYIKDLNRVDVNDLKKFFLRWYGPNNATLTIGGDLDQAQTIEWIAKYFGPIPRGPEVLDPEVPVYSLDADRYISMEDNVSLPLIQMVWPTVYARHADEAPLDLLQSIIGSGESSIIYKNLVKTGFSVDAGISHSCSELDCNFSFYALPNPQSGKTLADMESNLRAAFAEFETKGVQDEDLERIKSGIVARMIYGLESVSGKVTKLASAETFAHDPNFIKKNIERYSNVTKEDVMRVYNKYIKNKPSVIMSVVPTGKLDQVAHADTYQPSPRKLPEYKKIDPDSLKVRRTVDNFDRSVQPPSGPSPVLKVPPIWRDTLANGLQVMGTLNDEIPTIAVNVRFPAGHNIEPRDKLGLANITAQMMNEATLSSTSEEISARLEALGSGAGIAMGGDNSVLQISSLTKNLDETLSIAVESLFEPKFDQADFDRIKSQVLQNIESSKKRASATAARVYSKLLFGNENVVTMPGQGTLETVQSITLDDVKKFYENHYSPKGGTIVAVGDVTQAELVEKLRVFEKWDGDEPVEVVMKPFPELAAGTLYLVDKPGAAQSQIRIGKRSLTYDSNGEYYRLGLMNFNLGGAFNSRINMNLREDKAYTYGARSSFRGDKYTGTFTASAGVRSDATDLSIIEFEKEIENFRKNGINEAELAFLQKSLGQSDARSYETPGQKLGFISQILTYHLADNYTDEQSDILQNITVKEINDLAAKHLNLDEMILVVVGDKKSILPGLKALGHPIVELDADGNPL